jgi:hypothetical protein
MPKTGPKPRGICPVCGAERALRGSGVMGSHQRMVRSRSGAFAYRTGRTCSGTDQPPVSEVGQNQDRS